MVDTGAAVSVISASLLEGRNAVAITRPQTTWRGVDGKTLPKIGEATLTLKYQHSIVDVPAVKVLSNAVYPLILGVDWINLSGASISRRNGMWEVKVPEPVVSAMSENAFS